MLIKFEAKTELSVMRVFCLLLEGLEQVFDADHGKCRLSKDTHDFIGWPANIKIMLDDCKEAVGDDCNVYMYAYGIFRLSLEMLDLKKLLDPFEKVMRSISTPVLNRMQRYAFQNQEGYRNTKTLCISNLILSFNNFKRH